MAKQIAAVSETASGLELRPEQIILRLLGAAGLSAAWREGYKRKYDGHESLGAYSRFPTTLRPHQLPFVRAFRRANSAVTFPCTSTQTNVTQTRIASQP